MDYTTQKLTFKIKKFLRYLALYGLSRTLIKVKGQYHMKKRYETLPAQLDIPKLGGHVGLIGCGNYQFSNIAYYLKKNYGSVIRGCMDTDIQRAASLYRQYDLRYYTDDASQLITDPAIDLVFIASNHASHAEYAIEALKAGKNVHIEKPHCVTEDQLRRLLETMSESDGKIVSVGYNRTLSRIGVRIKDHLGTQTGAAMLNWFIAGHELEPDHWYFQDAEGGRILGNLCHWTDFSYTMIDEKGRFPLKIIPTRSDKSDCDIAVSYVFGDGSIAAITFSAKGHTFEGVREKFSAHRGNVLISMSDFKSLMIEVIDKRIKPIQIFRDHGHEISICSSYSASKDSTHPGLSLAYIWESAQLFLATKAALENNQVQIINGIEDYFESSAFGQSQ
ncbi:MAG: Gfo/Idh/MocA family oxidoreductase [Gammaproteobacteria bacterium]|nr:Gfo/Idh/MocA family oxidoreductase [Gammaproteobacteria bacterium]